MLVLARHGLTAANEAGRLQGESDMGLSNTGRQQARRLANWASKKKFVKLLASDSLRAVETVQIVAEHLGMPFTLHAELRERDYNVYDGMSRNELVKVRRTAAHKFVDPTQDWFGVSEVESDREVSDRVSPLLKAIYPDPSSDSVLCITHAGVIKAYLYVTFAISPDRGNFIKVPNGAVLLLDYDEDMQLQLRGFYPTFEEGEVW